MDATSGGRKEKKDKFFKLKFEVILIVIIPYVLMAELV